MQNSGKWISIWLLAIIAMIFFQIVLGGITRLTNSGLSITEWELVTGTIPPIGNDAWETEFNKYKQIPQFQQLNPDMTLSEFKFIYFWEWIHRLWGRLIGLVVFLPFIFLIWKKQLSKPMMYRLGIGIILIGVVGAFGWIMVASGLGKDAWLWVDAYKLTAHLILALITMAYFIWIFLEMRKGKAGFFEPGTKAGKFSWFLIILTSFQLILGGMMSGTKAGRFYKNFPLMNGQVIPEAMHMSEINADAFINYQNDITLATIVQFFHRLTAYALVAFIIWFFFKYRKKALDQGLRSGILIMHIFVVIQTLIGIGALLHPGVDVPVYMGVLHQVGAILLLSSVLYVHYHVLNDRNAAPR